MSLEKLSLQHQPALQGRLKKISTYLSEFSFPNLYLFREPHEYHVLKENEELFLTGMTYDGFRFLMPTWDVRTKKLDGLIHAARDYNFIFPIPEEWLKAFADERVTLRYADGDSDYIYTVEKISTYRGPKLHGKKNLLNQFLSLYSSAAKPLTRDRLPDALDVLESWQSESGQDQRDTDYFPCQDAFKLYDELILCGGIYYAQGEPAGFIIGEELTPKMFALHFAKGKRKFKGIYQYMFNHFASILPKTYELLNFEQDMGKQALKIAKSSYHPDQVLKKYRVYLGK